MNASNLYSGRACFECRLGSQLLWLRYSWFSSALQVNSEIAHWIRPWPLPSPLLQFVTVISHSTSKWAIDRVDKYTTNKWTYCNVDDKALLGNDSVKQQWKRSDSCYAKTQYKRVNNGGEDVFCMVGAVVILWVWSQFHTTTEWQLRGRPV
jgi:hypothetical protein